MKSYMYRKLIYEILKETCFPLNFLSCKGRNDLLSLRAQAYCFALVCSVVVSLLILIIDIVMSELSIFITLFEI